MPMHSIEIYSLAMLWATVVWRLVEYGVHRRMSHANPRQLASDSALWRASAMLRPGWPVTTEPPSPVRNRGLWTALARHADHAA
jgi:hypothetical protein